jgi:hypothetical protein
VSRPGSPGLLVCDAFGFHGGGDWAGLVVTHTSYQESAETVGMEGEGF